eukprot:Nitzschia sp. Nitz4//scaffold151_size53849//13729//14910//NITZ4_006716-RA/size53849-processed-gene-0.56-mRNA-1//1//CDS//3329537123//854//frame0
MAVRFLGFASHKLHGYYKAVVVILLVVVVSIQLRSASKQQSFLSLWSQEDESQPRLKPNSKTSGRETRGADEAESLKKLETPEIMKLPPYPNNSSVVIDEDHPILVWTSMSGFNRREPCDVPCQYTTKTDLRSKADACVLELRGYRAPPSDCKFSAYLQMEGEHYYPIKMDGYQLENSYNWRSPLLKPYFEWVNFNGRLNIQNPPVRWNETIDGATFIARNCNSRNNREQVIRDLMEAGIRVDSLSSCLHNFDPPQKKEKLAMMQPYKLNLAFENGNVVDYVTEKVYQALASGVVPVYLGAPNIDLYVPDNSIINAGLFNSTKALAEHLKQVMQNETLFNSYQAWRSKPLPEWFLQRFNFTYVTTECRTCRYLQAYKMGWGWDKENQRGVPNI